jgi:hypothetical protein
VLNSHGKWNLQKTIDDTQIIIQIETTSLYPRRGGTVLRTFLYEGYTKAQQASPEKHVSFAQVKLLLQEQSETDFLAGGEAGVVRKWLGEEWMAGKKGILKEQSEKALLEGKDLGVKRIYTIYGVLGREWLAGITADELATAAGTWMRAHRDELKSMWNIYRLFGEEKSLRETSSIPPRRVLYTDFQIYSSSRLFEDKLLNDQEFYALLKAELGLQTDEQMKEAISSLIGFAHYHNFDFIVSQYLKSLKQIDLAMDAVIALIENEIRTNPKIFQQIREGGDRNLSCQSSLQRLLKMLIDEEESAIRQKLRDLARETVEKLESVPLEVTERLKAGILALKNEKQNDALTSEIYTLIDEEVREDGPGYLQQGIKQALNDNLDTIRQAFESEAGLHGVSGNFPSVEDMDLNTNYIVDWVSYTSSETAMHFIELIKGTSEQKQAAGQMWIVNNLEWVGRYLFKMSQAKPEPRRLLGDPCYGYPKYVDA